MILHLLWALHFTKAYLKQDTRSAAAGGSSESELLLYLAGVLCKKLTRYALCFPVLQIIAESRKRNLSCLSDCLFKR